MAVIEIRTFRGTAADPEIAAADARVQQEFAYQQPGLVRRTTAHAPHGWVVVTVWRTPEDADRAGAAEATDPAVSDLLALVADVQTQRYQTIE